MTSNLAAVITRHRYFDCLNWDITRYIRSTNLVGSKWIRGILPESAGPISTHFNP